MTDDNRFISIDQHGVKRIAGTRISVDSVVIGFQQGQSPEEIQRNFPSLTLEQVYGIITYYLGHREQIDAYLSQQEQVWNRERAKAEREVSATVQRLRQIRQSKAGQPQ